MTDDPVTDRALGSLLGLAIGDALGTTLEFTARDAQPPVTDMVGGGRFSWQSASGPTTPAWRYA
jgi:ADP-ribosylglycohydrolase